MNDTVHLELWARTLEAYRALHGAGKVVIRAGTQPILDLVVLEQCSARDEVWFLYPRHDYDLDFWNAIMLLPQYQDRLNVSTAAAPTHHLTGTAPDVMLDSDAWVMSVQPQPQTGAI